MEQEKTKVIAAEDEDMTRAVFEFGPPDETLSEVDPNLRSSVSTSMQSEQLRLNRHFLEDAAPFDLELLGQSLLNRSARLEIHSEPEWSVPLESLVVIRGDAGSGKSCLLMNIMWRLSELYPKHHLLFYTLERSKPETLLHLLLLGTQQTLTEEKGFEGQIKAWRRLLMEEDPESLKKRAEVEPSLTGLHYMLQQGHRLHVVDRLNTLGAVLTSLETFAKSLPLTAVFVDGADWLLHLEPSGLSQVLAQFRRLARSLGIVIFITLGPSAAETPRSSTLCESVGRLSEPWGGGGGSLILDWQTAGRAFKLELPLAANNQRVIWNQVSEFDDIQ